MSGHDMILGALNLSEEGGGSGECNYTSPDWLLERFILIVIGGGCIGVTSIVENLLLLYVLLSRPAFRASHFFFLTLLAFQDLLVCIAFLLLFPLQILFDFIPSPGLSKAWHSLLCPAFTLSHISLAASTFLIIAATIERFVSIAKLGTFSKKLRVQSAAAAIGLAFLMKGSVYFELTPVVNGNCTGLARYAAEQTALSRNPVFRKFWMFYLRNFVMVFCPFGILSVLNILIVTRMRSQYPQSANNSATYHQLSRDGTTCSSGPPTHSRKELNRATRMLILVVTMYLVTSVPNLFVTIWENLDEVSLKRDHSTMYSIITDLTSILCVLCSALRLPIYLWCNPPIRKVFKELIASFLFLRPHPRTGKLQSRFSTAIETRRALHTLSRETAQIVTMNGEKTSTKVLSSASESKLPFCGLNGCNGSDSHPLMSPPNGKDPDLIIAQVLTKPNKSDSTAF